MGLLVTVTMGLFLILVLTIEDLRNPASLGDQMRKAMRSLTTGAVVMGLLFLGAYLTIATLMDRGESRVANELEFATGMTQALERVAYLRGGEGKASMEWSGQDRDGSRYALLRDDAGPFVRTENLSARACAAALNHLSAYANSVLVMRDERGLTRLDARTGRCPEADGRLQAVFRAPSLETPGSQASR